jgi:hypothetical protein
LCAAAFETVWGGIGHCRSVTGEGSAIHFILKRDVREVANQ